MPYQPGTHIIASLSTTNEPLLKTSQSLQTAVNGWIEEHGLTKLGEVYHDFTPAGFTAVICLSESHISLHTWPEYGRINLDIYLSNHLRDNDGTTRALYEKLRHWFGAEILQEQTLKR